MQGVGRVGAKRRVLLKLSGEALMGDSAYGIDPAVAVSIASQIHDAQRSPIISGSDDEPGVEIAIVVGGGNIWRGLAASSKGMDRSTADYMGMVATVLNGLALQDALEHQSVFTRVMTAIQMPVAFQSIPAIITRGRTYPVAR